MTGNSSDPVFIWYRSVGFSLSALVASQWLGLCLQFIGVAMVTAVAFIAVLEHHFSTVDPGEWWNSKKNQIGGVIQVLTLSAFCALHDRASWCKYAIRLWTVCDLLVLTQRIAVPGNGIDHGIVPFVVPLFPTDKRKPHRVYFASISVVLKRESGEGSMVFKPNFLYEDRWSPSFCLPFCAQAWSVWPSRTRCLSRTGCRAWWRHSQRRRSKWLVWRELCSTLKIFHLKSALTARYVTHSTRKRPFFFGASLRKLRIGFENFSFFLKMKSCRHSY